MNGGVSYLDNGVEMGQAINFMISRCLKSGLGFVVKSAERHYTGFQRPRPPLRLPKLDPLQGHDWWRDPRTGGLVPWTLGLAPAQVRRPDEICGVDVGVTTLGATSLSLLAAPSVLSTLHLDHVGSCRGEFALRQAALPCSSGRGSEDVIEFVLMVMLSLWPRHFFVLSKRLPRPLRSILALLVDFWLGMVARRRKTGGPWTHFWLLKDP